MVGLAVALVKDLRSDPLMVRKQYAEEAVEQAVITGVTEHGDDFVLAVDKDPNGLTARHQLVVERPSLVEAGGRLDADDRALVELGEVARRRRTCRPTGRRSRSGRSGPRRPGGPGRGTSATTRCPPRRGPCGPGRRPTRVAVRLATARADAIPKDTLNARPSASCSRSPGDSWVPANQEPIITEEAPAARARATSRGCRTPPSAQTCLPSSRAASAHSSTAENCGRPTPVIIRVVHMAPGPTPTLTMSAPASIRARVPSAETTLPATTGTRGSSVRTTARAPRASGPGGRGRCRRRGSRRRRRAAPSALAATSRVDADRGRDPQAAVGRRPPAGRPWRAARRSAVSTPVSEPSAVDRDRERRAGGVERVEGGPRVGVVGDPHERRVHHLLDLREAVHLDAVGLADHADRAVPSSTTTAARCERLGISDSASATVWSGRSSIGVSKTWCRDFTNVTTSATTGDRDVLRDHREPAAAGHGLGHPLAGDGRHVRDDERQGGPGAVGGGQVHVVPAGHRRVPGHHEDVVVGQVVRRGRVIEEAHIRDATR